MWLITFNLIEKNESLENISKINSKIDNINKRLAGFQKSTGELSINDFYRGKPAMVDVIRQLRVKLKVLNEQKSQIKNPVDFLLIPLGEDIVENPEARKQLNENYKFLEESGFQVKSK